MYLVEFRDGKFIAGRVETDGKFEQVYVFNLRELAAWEASMEALGTLTSQAAPEFLTRTNRIVMEMTQMLTQARALNLSCQKLLRETRSQVLIDDVPGLILERKLKDTDSHREALLTLDSKVKQAQVRADFAVVFEKFLNDKRQHFIDCFQAVRRMYASVFNPNPGLLPSEQNRGLNGR